MTLEVPSGWYEPWERVVSDWQSLMLAFSETALMEDRAFYWRGQTNSRWGLHSSLARHFIDPKAESTGELTEDAVSSWEDQLLLLAQQEWKLDVDDVLNFFAKFQHEGGQTRLMDVSRNPLVATYFACQLGENEKEDGRIFGFAVDPNLGHRNINFKSNLWPFIDLRPSRINSYSSELSFQIWELPRQLDHRVLPQSSAVIFGKIQDGHPSENFRQTKSPGSISFWERHEQFQATSLEVELKEFGDTSYDESSDYFMYTIRITASAKEEILKNLRKIAGISSSTLFPRIAGLQRSTKEIQSPNQENHDRIWDGF